MDSKICIRCDAPIAYKNASFCSNCGLSLENFCTNEDCELNQEDTLDTLDPSDRYCYCCGYPSDYLSLGVIKDYKD